MKIQNQRNAYIFGHEWIFSKRENPKYLESAKCNNSYISCEICPKITSGMRKCQILYNLWGVLYHSFQLPYLTIKIEFQLFMRK